MNCYDLRVLEFWKRNASTDYQWVRFHGYEIALPDQRDHDDRVSG